MTIEMIYTRKGDLYHAMCLTEAERDGDDFKLKPVEDVEDDDTCITCSEPIKKEVEDEVVDTEQGDDKD